MNVATKIINKFGGTRKAATALNLAPSTVQSWKDAGVIPTRHQNRVLEIGSALADPVTPIDFFAPSLPEAITRQVAG